MPVDYSLYLVTDRGILNGRDLFLAVEEAIIGGVTLVQLREKDISAIEFIDTAKKILQITRKYNIPLIINDSLDVAIATGADGLHIGQDDLPLIDMRKLLGKDKILGYSATTVKEAIYGEKNGADYIGAGPIYQTNSKLDAAPPIGTERLREMKRAVSIPVVGIGGIGVSNVGEIKATGADGVSLISAIFGSEDIEVAAKTIKDLWRLG